MLIGLEVTDERGYQAYRDGMTPMLIKAGGKFGIDFKVSDLSNKEQYKKINRLFTISFPDSQTADEFFKNPEYQAVRREFFNPSVASTEFIAKYTKGDQ